MSYGKMNGGDIVFAPKKIKDGDSIIYNPTPEMLEKIGYKPIDEADIPESGDGYHYELGFVEDDEVIHYQWIKVEDEPVAEDIVAILTGDEE